MKKDFNFSEIEAESFKISPEEAADRMEDFRVEAHQIIDRQIDDFIFRLTYGEEARPNLRSLGTNPKELKGSRPAAIYIPGRGKICVKTWQQAAHEILKDCNADEERHNMLMYLRNRVHGRFRTFISDSPDNMGKPIRVDDGLYVEGNFDTEALIRMLKKEIFPYTKYKWQGILVELREQTMEVKEEYLVGSRRLRSEDVSFSDEIIQNDHLLEFYMEVVFDPDEVFGTQVCTAENDDWLNVYANYNMDAGCVCDDLDVYLVEGTGNEQAYKYRLTDEEKSLLLPQMERYCQKQTGMGLADYSAQLMDADMAPPTGPTM